MFPGSPKQMDACEMHTLLAETKVFFFSTAALHRARYGLLFPLPYRLQEVAWRVWNAFGGLVGSLLRANTVSHFD